MEIINYAFLCEIFGGLLGHKEVCQIEQSFLELNPLKICFQMSKIAKKHNFTSPGQ